MTRKTQKKLRKLLTLVSCAVLLVCVTVVGTVAYLTSTTQTVQNTFTTGNVSITLDEAKVNDAGKEITGEGAERVTANSYKLFPGGVYDKDPTIHVSNTTEDAWLKVKVVFTNGAAVDSLGLPMLDIFKTIDEDAWTIGAKQVGQKDVTYYLTYKNKITKSTGDIVLFDTVEIPGTLTNDQVKLLDGVVMNITAYAVQADGFDSADAAFTAAVDNKEITM